MIDLTVVESSHESCDPQVREYGRVRALWGRIVREVWWFRLYRWLPRLVWHDDEIDVVITFREDRLPDGMTMDDNPIAMLFSGGLYDVEKRLREMGVGFDTGMGGGGRDWQWDWSLSGPVSVRFRGRAKHPERRVRKECSRPTLVATPPR